jgi:PAS domain-containing protein
MTSPMSKNMNEPAAEAISVSARRRKLARKWAYLVSLTAYLPMPHAEIEHELLDLTHRVFDAMTCEPLPTDRVAEVGARLVELHCVGKASLQCSIDVLAGGLLSEPELRRFDRLPERVAHLIGALASGYVEATRSSTLQQQDNLHRALLEAMWISERNLKTSRSWLDEVLACSPSGIAITDLNGAFIRVNDAFDRILARPATKVSLFDLVDLRSAYRDLLDGKLERLNLRPELSRPNGDPIRISLTAALLLDADSEPSNYVTIVVDSS